GVMANRQRSEGSSCDAFICEPPGMSRAKSSDRAMIDPSAHMDTPNAAVAKRNLHITRTSHAHSKYAAADVSAQQDLDRPPLVAGYPGIPRGKAVGFLFSGGPAR